MIKLDCIRFGSLFINEGYSQMLFLLFYDEKSVNVDYDYHQAIPSKSKKKRNI